MGLAKKHRKKFISHKKRWDKKTIEDESILMNDYSLKNKKAIRKVELKLSNYKKIAKSLNTNIQTKQSDEAKQFIEKLKTLGFLDPSAQSLDEVLDIQIRDILDRRLSNILYKNKMARTPAQSRQFIVHGHVLVGNQCVNSPSYTVSLLEEPLIKFKNESSLNNESHPERVLASGGMVEVEEMEKIPLNKKEEDFDKKEAKLDDEEISEVIE
ncbi:MAG: 30S ribosomal protein S4 [Nanoarchaeota archaeon]